MARSHFGELAHDLIHAIPHNWGDDRQRQAPAHVFRDLVPSGTVRSSGSHGGMWREMEEGMAEEIPTAFDPLLFYSLY